MTKQARLLIGQVVGLIIVGAPLLAQVKPQQAENREFSYELALAIREGSFDKKISAAATIAMTPQTELVQLLVSEVVNTNDPALRQALVDALARIQDDCCWGVLSGLLGPSTALDLRYAACSAFVSASSEAAVEALIEQARQNPEDYALRKQISYVLASLKRAEAVPALLRNLDTEDMLMFRGIVGGLANIRTIDAVNGLKRYASSISGEERLTIVREALAVGR